MIRLAILTAAVVAATPAPAQRGDSMAFANELGSILAAEAFCGLAFNQDAIRALIEKRVRADDLGFPSTLALMTSGAEAIQEDMRPSQKTAHCAQVARVARSFGLLR